jgi:hypothetical protein
MLMADRPGRRVDPLRPQRADAQRRADAQIAGSIREFGFTNPILIDGENGIIAGHGRVLAARNSGAAHHISRAVFPGNEFFVQSKIGLSAWLGENAAHIASQTDRKSRTD